MHPPAGAVDARLDPAHEPVAEEHRQHVPAPTPLRRRHEELPHIVELEQGSEEAPVPDQWIERGQECDGGWRLRGSFQQSDLLLQHVALAAHRLDLDGNELAVGDQLLAQCRSARMPGPPQVWFGGAEASVDVAAAADAEEAVGTVPREELVSELFPQWDAARK